MVRNLGQELLAPPNVKGWDGGLSWITTNTLLTRYNQASLLVMGQGNLPPAGGGGPGQAAMAGRADALGRQMPPINVNNIVTASERQDQDLLLAALRKRFLLAPLPEEHARALRGYLDEREELRDDDIRHVIRLLLATPEFQIC
jgi:uncharacterized protein (DUF1800 family)